MEAKRLMVNIPSFKNLFIAFLVLEIKMLPQESFCEPSRPLEEVGRCHMTRFCSVMFSDVLLGLFPPSAENWFNDDFQEPQKTF